MGQTSDSPATEHTASLWFRMGGSFALGMIFSIAAYKQIEKGEACTATVLVCLAMSCFSLKFKTRKPKQQAPVCKFCPRCGYDMGVRETPTPVPAQPTDLTEKVKRKRPKPPPAPPKPVDRLIVNGVEQYTDQLNREAEMIIEQTYASLGITRKKRRK